MDIQDGCRQERNTVKVRIKVYTLGEAVGDRMYLCNGIEQRFQKLIYLHMFTDCFMKISLQSSAQI